MKETVFKKRLVDVERAIEKVDPTNRGFTGSALAEYLNSKYDGPPAKKGVANRKINSSGQGQWASGTSVSNILRIAHYPYIQQTGRTYFHLGTNAEGMQKKHDKRVTSRKKKKEEQQHD